MFAYLYPNLDDLFEARMCDPRAISDAARAEAGLFPNPLYPYSSARPASPKWGRSPARSKSLPALDLR